MRSNYTYLIAVLTVLLLLCCMHANGCDKVRLVNMTKNWDKHDQEVMDHASATGCKKHFSDMPCLRVFIKLNERDYSVICGKVQPEATEWKGYNVY